VTRPVKRLVYWMPRVLGILLAVFLSIFALDVFGEGYDFWETILALVMHLLPTGIVLVVLAIAWRWEWVGAVLFVALGAGYLALTWGRFEWPGFLPVAGPLFLVGIVFLVNWLYRAQLQARI
jgi:hypothetical protein